MMDPNPWTEHSDQRQVALPVPTLLLWVEVLTLQSEPRDPRFAAGPYSNNPPCTPPGPPSPLGLDTSKAHLAGPIPEPCTSPPGQWKRTASQLDS